MEIVGALLNFTMNSLVSKIIFISVYCQVSNHLTEKNLNVKMSYVGIRKVVYHILKLNVIRNKFRIILHSIDKKGYWNKKKNTSQYFAEPLNLTCNFIGIVVVVKNLRPFEWFSFEIFLKKVQKLFKNMVQNEKYIIIGPSAVHS